MAAVLLDTAGDALVGRPSGDPLVERLRLGLADAAAGGAVGAELLVATNLARLPWTGSDWHQHQGKAFAASVSADSSEARASASARRESGRISSTSIRPDR